MVVVDVSRLASFQNSPNILNTEDINREQTVISVFLFTLTMKVL